jgi:hypothetical protein
LQSFNQWGLVIVKMQEITVAYASNEMCQLADAVYLKDAIDDLPPVCSFRHKYIVNIVCLILIKF